MRHPVGRAVTDHSLLRLNCHTASRQGAARWADQGTYWASPSTQSQSADLSCAFVICRRLERQLGHILSCQSPRPSRPGRARRRPKGRTGANTRRRRRMLLHGSCRRWVMRSQRLVSRGPAGRRVSRQPRPAVRGKDTRHPRSATRKARPRPAAGRDKPEPRPLWIARRQPCEYSGPSDPPSNPSSRRCYEGKPTSARFFGSRRSWWLSW